MALCCLAQSYARVQAPKEEEVKESGKQLRHVNIKDHDGVFVKEKMGAAAGAMRTAARAGGRTADRGL
jgi:hypothetical protein